MHYSRSVKMSPDRGVVVSCNPHVCKFCDNRFDPEDPANHIRV